MHTGHYGALWLRCASTQLIPAATRSFAMTQNNDQCANQCSAGANPENDPFLVYVSKCLFSSLLSKL